MYLLFIAMTIAANKDSMVVLTVIRHVHGDAVMVARGRSSRHQTRRCSIRILCAILARTALRGARCTAARRLIDIITYHISLGMTGRGGEYVHVAARAELTLESGQCHVRASQWLVYTENSPMCVLRYRNVTAMRITQG